MGSDRKARRGWMGLAAQAGLVAVVAALSVGLNTRFDAPPRYDGAGYVVLARSLLSGHGYRAIDHPDRPLHAHFPPGYPLTLAGLWSLTGPSDPAAHGLSMACTTAAAVGFWLWFRRLYPPRTALLLGVALAANWTWGRAGGSIQSEPLFLALEAAALLAATRAGDGRGGPWVLGPLLGAAMLTRHVGASLALAAGIDLLRRGRTRAAVVAALGAAAVVGPWAWWLATAGGPSQLDLFPRGGLAQRVASNALFYLHRLPDQITGPVVEVATVFRPAFRQPATLWATLATGLVVGGWFRALRSPRLGLAGLVPLATLGLLLVWPFTEAGRFLIPLVPLILVGGVEGLGAVAGRLRLPHPRGVAAAALLILTLPYAGYAIASARLDALERTHAGFDAAVAWLAERADRPGPVLTRHPGEVYLRTGRAALTPPEDGPDAIAREIDRRGVAYLLIDDDRFARATASPLGRFISAHPKRVERVDSRSGSVAIYAIVGPNRPAEPPPDTAGKRPLAVPSSDPGGPRGAGR